MYVTQIYHSENKGEGIASYNIIPNNSFGKFVFSNSHPHNFWSEGLEILILTRQCFH